jgi:hypothetical protein
MALEEIRKSMLKESSLICYAKCAVIFLSGFPDPFQDDGGGENCPTSQDTPPVLPPSLNLPAVSCKPGAHKLESVSQCITTASPPTSPTLAPPRGHRRNMSDTSAFNKYEYGTSVK